MKPVSDIRSFCRQLLPISVLTALTLAAGATQAGPGASGGENAVVCFNDPAIPSAIRDPNSPRRGIILDAEVTNNVVSVESYDLFEAKLPRGFDRKASAVIPANPNSSPRDYVEKIAKRLEHFLPGFAGELRSENPDDKHIIMRPAALHRIHDENDVGVIDTHHCVVTTMAAQYKVGDELFFQIDDRLFNHPLHSELSKGVLFLHEILYMKARKLTPPHLDSRATRTLVGILINQAPLPINELTERIVSLNFVELLGSDAISKPRHAYFVFQSTKDLVFAYSTKLMQFFAERDSQYRKNLEKPCASRPNLLGWASPEIEPWCMEMSQYRTRSSEQISAACEKAESSLKKRCFEFSKAMLKFAQETDGLVKAEVAKILESEYQNKIFVDLAKYGYSSKFIEKMSKSLERYLEKIIWEESLNSKSYNSEYLLEWLADFDYSDVFIP